MHTHTHAHTRPLIEHMHTTNTHIDPHGCPRLLVSAHTHTHTSTPARIRAHACPYALAGHPSPPPRGSVRGSRPGGRGTGEGPRRRFRLLWRGLTPPGTTVAVGEGSDTGLIVGPSDSASATSVRGLWSGSRSRAGSAASVGLLQASQRPIAVVAGLGASVSVGLGGSAIGPIQAGPAREGTAFAATFAEAARFLYTL